MTAAVIGAVEPKLDVGWVAASTARILFRRSVDLLIVGVPFVWLPTFLTGFLPPEPSGLQLVAGLPALVFCGGASLLAYRDLTRMRLMACRRDPRGLPATSGTLWAVGFTVGLLDLLGLVLLVAFPASSPWASLMTASTAAMVEGIGVERCDRPRLEPQPWLALAASWRCSPSPCSASPVCW